MLPKISIFTISSPTQKSEDEDSYQWYFPKNSSYFISKTKGKTLVVDENTYKKLNKKSIPFIGKVIIFARSDSFRSSECDVVYFLDSALDAIKENGRDAVIICCREILNLFLNNNLVDFVHVAKVKFLANNAVFAGLFVQDFTKLQPIVAEPDFDDYNQEHLVEFETYMNKKRLNARSDFY